LKSGQSSYVTCGLREDGKTGMDFLQNEREGGLEERLPMHRKGQSCFREGTAKKKRSYKKGRERKEKKGGRTTTKPS